MLPKPCLMRRSQSGKNAGSGSYLVMVSGGLLGEEDPFAEQGESGPAVHLAFDRLDPVDVALDRS
jgi:hypothetical protein